MLAGCVQSGPEPNPAAGNDLPSKPNLVSPTFAVRPEYVARGLPGIFQNTNGASEPTLVVGPDETLYLRYFGCSDGFHLEAMAVIHFGLGMRQTNCVHQPMLRSTDHGQTWNVLNDETGRLSQNAPASSGYASVVVDPSGRLFAIETSCLVGPVDYAGEGGCNEQETIVQTSSDQGANWAYLGDVAPLESQKAADPGLAAPTPEQIVVVWREDRRDPVHPRAFGARLSEDGGHTFAPPFYMGERITGFGEPLFADANHGYVPYAVQITPEPDPNDPLPAPYSDELRLAITEDGGRTWMERTTGTVIDAPIGSRACLAGLPGLAVASDGRLVYVYAQSDGATNSFAVKMQTSADHGVTWGAARTVSNAPTAIFPSITALDDNRVAIAYVVNTLEGDPNLVGLWDLRAALIDLDTDEQVDVLVDDVIHEGGLSLGGADIDRAVQVDYSLGTSLSILNAAGRVAIAYVSDPATGGSVQEIHFAIQDASAGSS